MCQFLHFSCLFLLVQLFFPDLANGEKGCAGFGWTLHKGDCVKPFTYFVTQQQASQLCQMVGAQLVSVLSQADSELAKLASEELKMLSMISAPNGTQGKQNGVLCKRAAVDKAPLTSADTLCPDVAPVVASLKASSSNSADALRSASSSASSSQDASSSSRKSGSSSSSGGKNGRQSGYSSQDNLVINIYGGGSEEEERGRGGRGGRAGHSSQQKKLGSRNSQNDESLSLSSSQKKGRKNSRNLEEDEEEEMKKKTLKLGAVKMGIAVKAQQGSGRSGSKSEKGRSFSSSSDKAASSDFSADASSSSSSDYKEEEEEEASFSAKSSKKSSSSSSSSSSKKYEEEEEEVEES